MTMTSQEAEVFHKLRVATPLPSRTGHPVSLVFNGVSANSWLSPIGISNQQKENRGEQYIAQRPQTTGSIAIIRHHPKPTGLKRDEILAGRHLSGKCDQDSLFTEDSRENAIFSRPLAFEEDYMSPIGVHMFNQKAAKKGYRGGGFCDGPQKRPRPYTGKGQPARSTREQPISLELTVKSLELNKHKPDMGLIRSYNEQQLERQHHQLLNVDAYEDLSKTCVRRAKSAPPVSRPLGGSKTPSLYWRAKSAYHRKLMTPSPDTDLNTGENTQVLRGSMLRPLMYSSSSDIQHSAGCPYKCKGCFKACLVSQDYLEKARKRRLPMRTRRDFRQRSMMKKDPRYILHQALARNQPIYKLVHGYCDEQTVKEAWDDGGTIRGNPDDSLHPDQFSVLGERGVDSLVGTHDDFLSECETHSQDLTTEDEESKELFEKDKDQEQSPRILSTTNTESHIANSVSHTGSNIKQRVKSAEHYKRPEKVTLQARSKSCSEADHDSGPAKTVGLHKTRNVIQNEYTDTCASSAKNENDEDPANPQLTASDTADVIGEYSQEETSDISNYTLLEKRILRREMAVDVESEGLGTSEEDTVGAEREEAQRDKAYSKTPSRGKPCLDGQSVSEEEESSELIKSDEDSDTRTRSPAGDSYESETSNEEDTIESDNTVTNETVSNTSVTGGIKHSQRPKKKQKQNIVKNDPSSDNEGDSEENSDVSDQTLQGRKVNSRQSNSNSSHSQSSKETSDTESYSSDFSRSSKRNRRFSGGRKKKSTKVRKSVNKTSKKEFVSIDDNDTDRHGSKSALVKSRSISVCSAMHSGTESELQFDTAASDDSDKSSSDDGDDESSPESDDKSTEKDESGDEEKNISRKKKKKKHPAKSVPAKKPLYTQLSLKKNDKRVHEDPKQGVEKGHNTGERFNASGSEISFSKTRCGNKDIKRDSDTDSIDNENNGVEHEEDEDDDEQLHVDDNDIKKGRIHLSNKVEKNSVSRAKAKHSATKNDCKHVRHNKKKAKKTKKSVKKVAIIDNTGSESDNEEKEKEEEEKEEKGEGEEEEKEEETENDDEEQTSNDEQDNESEDSSSDNLSEKKQKTTKKKNVDINNKYKLQNQRKSRKLQKFKKTKEQAKTAGDKGKPEKKSLDDQINENDDSEDDAVSKSVSETEDVKFHVSESDSNNSLGSDHQSQDEEATADSDNKEGDSEDEQSDARDDDSDTGNLSCGRDGESESERASEANGSGQESKDDVQNSQSEEEREEEELEDDEDEDEDEDEENSDDDTDDD